MMYSNQIENKHKTGPDPLVKVSRAAWVLTRRTQSDPGHHCTTATANMKTKLKKELKNNVMKCYLPCYHSNKGEE